MAILRGKAGALNPAQVETLRRNLHWIKEHDNETYENKILRKGGGSQGELAIAFGHTLLRGCGKGRLELLARGLDCLPSELTDNFVHPEAKTMAIPPIKDYSKNKKGTTPKMKSSSNGSGASTQSSWRQSSNWSDSPSKDGGSITFTVGPSGNFSCRVGDTEILTMGPAGRKISVHFHN